MNATFALASKARDKVQGYILNRIRTYRAKASDREVRKERRERWTVIGLLLAAAFAFCQLMVMRSQLGEMESSGKQADDLIKANVALAESAKKQAEAAASQAAAAVESVKIARDNLLAAERAWIGPTAAAMNTPIQLNNPIKVTINYGNTGRQPAQAITLLGSKTYSIDDWNGGVIAAKDIDDFRKGCMNANVTLAPTMLVVYPTTGFQSYMMNLDSASKNNPENLRYVASDKLISGDEIFALTGCIVYKTVETVHHSAFCYYYRANITQPNNLSFCSIGYDFD
jgi:hypothetical protein